ncbi:unnamed protein product [Spirodela intermedia]|uniref:Uncharacterized protein n=1 Tax=Spirodela intermedia TaxID=51605 RepID=A0A7I8K6M7_SPIIN|nr:unnamed protein product [Spirodela intermedia]
MTLVCLILHWRSARNKSLSHTCMTTPCPTAGWPPMMWKGSGAHVPPSVQAARAPARGYSPTTLPTRLPRLAGRSPDFAIFLF